MLIEAGSQVLLFAFASEGGTQGHNGNFSTGRTQVGR